jgi:predicted DsbA family dithiol-disulfide isomerase
MIIEIYSDIACPWCYLAKRRLEKALEDFAHRDEVKIIWRSYELAPDMPSKVAFTTAEQLIHEKGLTPAEAQARIDSLTKLAATMDLDLRFDTLKLFNTRKALELIHHAETFGRQGAMKERLFHANFTESRELGDIDVLVEMAFQVGLDPIVARQALESGRHTSAVVAEEARAQAMGVQIPYALFDGRHVITGAKRTEVFSGMLEKVWQEEQSAQVI